MLMPAGYTGKFKYSPRLSQKIGNINFIKFILFLRVTKKESSLKNQLK